MLLVLEAFFLHLLSLIHGVSSGHRRQFSSFQLVSTSTCSSAAMALHNKRQLAVFVRVAFLPSLCFANNHTESRFGVCDNMVSCVIRDDFQTELCMSVIFANMRIEK